MVREGAEGWKGTKRAWKETVEEVDAQMGSAHRSISLLPSLSPSLPVSLLLQLDQWETLKYSG